jgi:hypothetical protein
VTIYTTAYFIERANKIHNEKFLYENAHYITAKTKIIITCRTHGNFEQVPFAHLSGAGCPWCVNEYRGKCISSSTEQFISAARAIHPNFDYSQVDYKSARKKVKIICIQHGQFLQTPNQHLSGNGCPICKGISISKSKVSTLDDFIKKAIKIHGNIFSYKDANYINNRVKIRIICSKHGGFWQTPNDYLNGRGCALCSVSMGERKIASWLQNNEIHFKQQYRFENCKNQRLLSFDFAICKIDHILGLIEYQGIQHFQEVKYFGGKERLCYTKQNDEIKQSYCMQNKIPLLTIPYTCYNEIENILQKFVETIL